MNEMSAEPCMLEFGTGGIRERMGEGAYRLNRGTIARVAQGFADWLYARTDHPSVAIARDCRNNGEVFVAQTISVLRGNGIRVTDLGVCPTPMLSFAVRALGCSAGIVITASHNQRDWNGFKVYDADGCQATDGICGEVSRAIRAVTTIRVVACGNRVPGGVVGEGAFAEQAADACDDCVPDGAMGGDHTGAIQADDCGDQVLGLAVKDVGEAYLQAVSTGVPGRRATGLRVAYSPLNGTGWRLVPKLLEREGVSLVCVEEQMELDGNFPTCPYPNPERPEATRLVEELALRESCTLALATDPDADRLGVAVLHQGRMVRLSGDEVAELLVDWACRVLHDEGERLEGRVVLATIVTSRMLDEICARWGLVLKRTLTGFKYLGEQIGRLERMGDIDTFLVGVEESLGYLFCTDVRDKDGMQAAVAVCRMASWYAAQGLDLYEGLLRIHAAYGWHLKSQVVERYESRSELQGVMRGLRAKGAAALDGCPVVSFVDYQQGATMSGDATQSLPPSDVLEWRLADGSGLIVRPSGTETVIKAYCFARGASETEALNKRAGLEALARAAVGAGGN